MNDTTRRDLTTHCAGATAFHFVSRIRAGEFWLWADGDFPFMSPKTAFEKTLAALN